jgi:flagellar motility protein MotE (MotC chaperone)
MIRFARDFRLIPVVLLATISLFALKVSGLVFDGGYTLAERMQARYQPNLKVTTDEKIPDYPKIVVADQSMTPDVTASIPAPASKKSWAQQMFNYNDATGDDVTGSVDKAAKPADPPLKTSEKPPPPGKLEVGNLTVPLVPGHINSPGERAVLERLGERRKELDTRSHELDMRESLIKAAEKRLEAKVAELKGVETQVKTAMSNRDQAEAKRFKSIVSMYETMKPKEAARIFERLDLKVLVDVSTQMKPRAMSSILAAMAPESAEKLTVELARRANPPGTPQGVNRLPKIEGRPSGG